MLTPSKQVLQTRLVLAVGVTAVDHPPVAHEHAVEVGPQDHLGVVESAARADGVDGRRRGDGRPQSVGNMRMTSISVMPLRQCLPGACCAISILLAKLGERYRSLQSSTSFSGTKLA